MGGVKRPRSHSWRASPVGAVHGPGFEDGIDWQVERVGNLLVGEALAAQACSNLVQHR